MHTVWSAPFICFLSRFQHPEWTTDTAGWSSVMILFSSCRCTYQRKTGESSAQLHVCPLLISHTVSFCVSSRSVDILELSEQKDLLKFHYHTLRLYSAICALANNRVAHALCSHVNEAQLLQAIENKYMPGNTQHVNLCEAACWPARVFPTTFVSSLYFSQILISTLETPTSFSAVKVFIIIWPIIGGSNFLQCQNSSKDSALWPTWAESNPSMQENLWPTELNFQSALAPPSGSCGLLQQVLFLF